MKISVINEYYFTFSDDEKNVIHTIRDDMRYKLEHMATTSTPLKQYGTLIPTDVQFSSFQHLLKRGKIVPTEVVLRKVKEPTKILHFMAYICTVRNKANKIIHLKMTGGPTESSILFLTATTYGQRNLYMIKLMINNLYPEFLSYYL